MIPQVRHIRHCPSSRVIARDGQVLIEGARVLDASNMLAARVWGVLVHVENLVVDGCEEVSLGGAVAAGWGEIMSRVVSGCGLRKGGEIIDLGS